MDAYWVLIVTGAAMAVLGFGLAGLSIGTESFLRDLDDISRHDSDDER